MLQARTQSLACSAAIWLTATGLVCISHGAHANGRYPKADQLLIAPDDAKFLAARSTFGFLISRDSGQHWDWICERAIGYSGVQDPTLGLMENGTLIASLSEGIARSADRGCNWAFSEAPLNDSPVIDLTVRKNAPNQALALVWDAQSVGYSSRILASDDNGRSFAAHGNPIDPSVLVTTLDTAPSNPQRVYASGTRSVAGVRSGWLFRSDDDGEHWSEYPVPFDPQLEQGVYIAAVDPEDADTVYLRTSSASVSRLLKSHDGGQQIDVLYSGSLLAFALSPDGKQLYFGGEDGLHGGLAGDSTFEKRAGLRLLCLAASASTVYACSDEHSGFTIGASSDGGFTFEPVLHLKTVRGPLACSAATCASDWPLVQAQLGIPLASDAGAGAGAAGAGAEADAGSSGVQASAAKTQGSCSLAGSSPGNAKVLGLLLAIALGALNRRRKSRAASRLPAK
ncbi:MAG TPA: hypothetical protein VGJ91_01255 [Polyangiaceae bacterium]|jgi:hypothetical protein